MTYRELVNRLSDEEFAQTILNDVVLHMACSRSVVNDECPYKTHDCLNCIVKLLKSNVEDIDEI